MVVYSSGSFGQHILSTNTKAHFFEVVKWIDLDYHPLNIGGNHVQPISAVSNSDFDHLIIATINPTNHDEIKEELKLMGIDENKIVEINTNMGDIKQILMDLGFNDRFEFQKN